MANIPNECQKENAMKNYYKNRAFPGGHDRFNTIITNQKVGIGWSDIGSQQGKTKASIKDSLAKDYEFKNEHSLAMTAGYFIRLLSMKVGDRILIPYKKNVLIAEVSAPYEYNKEFADKYDMGHLVEISILKTVPVTRLSTRLKKSIDTIPTITDLSDYAEEIENVINEKQTMAEDLIKQSETETFSYNKNGKKIILTLNPPVTNDALRDFVKNVMNLREV